MHKGLYDYKQLADEFDAFVSMIAQKNYLLNDSDKNKISEFAWAFKGNQCYKLPEIRDKAILGGSLTIGIPVDLNTQNKVRERGGDSATAVSHVETTERATPRVFNTPPARKSAPNNAMRQSGGDVGSEVDSAPSAVQFDAFGDMV